MRPAYQLEWASKDLGQQSWVALGDVNGDGKINIVVGTAAAKGHSSNIYVFQYKGKTYHQLARASMDRHDTHWIGCRDIDRDGADEIIVGCTGGIHIYKMKRGSLVKIAESDELRETVSCAAIADIDRDGRPEIIAVVRGKPRIYVFRYEKRLVLVRTEPIKHPAYCVAVGDTDGDKFPEVVVKTHSSSGCHVYILSFKNGKRKDKWRGRIPDAKRAFLCVEDFDRDGKHEVIFDCRDNKIRALRHTRRGIERVWESVPHRQEIKDVSVYDIDGDGQKELIVVCLSEVYIYGWNGGKIVLEWNQTVPNGAFCITAGELNQKGYGEIVVGTIYGYIYVFEARRDMSRGRLWVGKVQAIIQDTVTIPNGKPDAARGVEAKARFTMEESKVICDKVIVDGNVHAKILYVAALPGHPVHFFQATFPFLEFIHLHGATPGMQALVYFNVEHINVDVVSPRRVKITVLFEMVVRLMPFHHHHGHHDCHHDCYHDPYDDFHHKHHKKHHDDFHHKHYKKPHDDFHHKHHKYKDHYDYDDYDYHYDDF